MEVKIVLDHKGRISLLTVPAGVNVNISCPSRDLQGTFTADDGFDDTLFLECSGQFINLLQETASP